MCLHVTAECVVDVTMDDEEAGGNIHHPLNYT